MAAEPYKICDSKEEAWAFLHGQAEILRNMGITERYGVYTQPLYSHRPNGPWGVYLTDRASGKGETISQPIRGLVG